MARWVLCARHTWNPYPMCAAQLCAYAGPGVAAHPIQVQLYLKTRSLTECGCQISLPWQAVCCAHGKPGNPYLHMRSPALWVHTARSNCTPGTDVLHQLTGTHIGKRTRRRTSLLWQAACCAHGKPGNQYLLMCSPAPWVSSTTSHCASGSESTTPMGTHIGLKLVTPLLPVPACCVHHSLALSQGTCRGVV